MPPKYHNDLDLEGRDWNSVYDTSSCYDDQLYQTISKFHHKQQRNGQEKNAGQTDGRTDNTGSIKISKSSHNKMFLSLFIQVYMK